MKNVLQLFREFNDGTHGTAGRFSLDQLSAIKTRVEHAVEFLWSIIPDNLRDPLTEAAEPREQAETTFDFVVGGIRSTLPHPVQLHVRRHQPKG